VKRASLATSLVAGLIGSMAVAAWGAEPAPAEPESATGENRIESFLNGATVQQNDDFLPVEQAFVLSANVTGPNTLRVRWLIADGYYLYKSKMRVETDSQLVQLGAPELPRGKSKTDEFFGTQEVYYHEATAQVPFSRARPDAGTFTAKVSYQGCADAGLCYPPTTQAIKLELAAVDAATFGTGGPDVVVSEQDRLARLIQTGNLFLVLASFFGFGLLLSFTPCVLPMVPILLRIIVGQGAEITTRRAFMLALAYVLGMAVTYTSAAVATAAAGEQVQALFQQTWIIVLFAALFGVLALAMFGAFELQMPSAIQTRIANLSSRQKTGTYIGTAVIGALSALIVTACVAPAMVASLMVIAQAGDVARGALANFAMSLGMGAPLLVVGASAGKLLPKAGPWMETVKRFFGVLFLAVSIWMLERILPGNVILALWGVLLVVAVFALGLFKPRAGRFGPILGRLAGVVAVGWGALMLVGAVKGNDNPFDPVRGLLSGKTAVASALPFKPVSSVEELDSEIAAARAAGKPAMLDFSAEWCVSCKEMEKYTFPDEGVRAALEGVVLLQADVTENNDQHKALLKRFRIFGPPTIAFFGPDGVERENYRIIGFRNAGTFREHVLRATAPAAPGTTTAQTTAASGSDPVQ
jgi:thiol:disulfide interchange protein DsbD